jgi:predicted nucleic acid-binding protein
LKRLVIDATTLVSGSANPHGESPPSLLYADLAGASFELIACPRLLAEIVGGIADAARMRADPTRVERLLRDPGDDYLVALARESGAEAIVSGDKDLLDHPGLEPAAIDARSACRLLGLLD